MRYAAVSNYQGWQVADAAHLAAAAHSAPVVANQIEWSLLVREAETETVPACRHFGVGVIPYFPLVSGLLTGKYKRGEPFPEGTRLASMSYFAGMATEERFDKIDRLQALAQERGHTITELAMSWLAVQPGVSCVLAGATKVEQVRTNAAAAGWALEADDLKAVELALAG